MATGTKVSFWRIFWASLIAGMVLIIIFFIMFTGLIGSLMSSQPEKPIDKNTVLHLKLKGQIGEISKSNVDMFSFGFSSQTGLMDLLHGFEKAATDDRIKGIFIELEGAQCGFATATEIRNAIKRFEEESGKFVIAYHSGEAVGLKQYYIASAASENYGFHSSMFEFLGLGSELMFYKGLFDKIGLEMQVVRGSNNDFKSAVEPYFLKEMSDSSRLQLETYLTNIWSAVKTNITEDKDITIDEIERIAEESLIKRVKQATEYKLIDETKYRDEVMQMIAEKSGAKEVEDINLSSFEKYAQKRFISDQNVAFAKNADIAVIVASGAITVDGDELTSKKITKLFQEVRNDKNIKAVVFRINSPGGSALASEEIWREVMLTKENKKVIVSMGDVAASGGYYIAAPADKIFAEQSTITGSIGVFGVIPFTGDMLEDNLGITFDRVATNKHAVLSTNKRMSPEEFNLIQEEVDYIYAEFLERVAQGRNMSSAAVNEIARGRVWTGDDALRIGLVDTLGGIQDAINYATQLVESKKPVIRYYPRVKKEPWMEIVETITEEGGDFIESPAISEDLIKIYKKIKKVEEMTGIQARLPFEIEW